MSQTKLGRVRGAGNFTSTAESATSVSLATISPSNITPFFEDSILFPNGDMRLVVALDSTTTICGDVITNIAKIRSGATIVVGFTGDCHYNINELGTATNAQTTINAAIAALPQDGGKIILREGIYNITSSIVVDKDNITLEGMGNSTVLKRMANYSNGVVHLTKKYCSIEKCCIDGNKTAFTATTNRGISLNGCSFCTITNVVCKDNCFQAIYMMTASNIKIINNILSNNNWGIGFMDGNSVIIIGNTITGNLGHGVWAAYHDYVTLADNLICNNGEDGFTTTYCPYSIITNNAINNNTGYGIYMDSNYNIISNNQVHGNKVATVYQGGTGNTWANNKNGNTIY